jgi:hypothetical protein
MLLNMKAHADAARAIALYAALQLDLARYESDSHRRHAAQARGDLLIPIVKAWSTEIGVLATSLGVQVHGGMGFVEETGAAQFYRDVRITPIYEGTTGIQAGDLVGRKVGRDGGAAMQSLIATMLGELQTMASTDAGVKRSATAAIDAVSQLREATAHIVESWPSAPEQAHAVAVPYLMLCGYVIGGWLLAKAHAKAVLKTAEDVGFYTAKQQIVNFYMEQLLPSVYALARIVTTGHQSVVAADPALLE